MIQDCDHNIKKQCQQWFISNNRISRIAIKKTIVIKILPSFKSSCCLCLFCLEEEMLKYNWISKGKPQFPSFVSVLTFLAHNIGHSQSETFHHGFLCNRCCTEEVHMRLQLLALGPIKS